MSVKTYIYGTTESIEKDGLIQAKIHKTIEEATKYVVRAAAKNYAVCVSPMTKKKR
jgi:hypothetical protein